MIFHIFVSEAPPYMIRVVGRSKDYLQDTKKGARRCVPLLALG